MGNVCRCQQAGASEMNEVLSQRVDPKEKEKRSETITIVNGLQQAPTRKFPNGKEAGDDEDQDEDDG